MKKLWLLLLAALLVVALVACGGSTETTEGTTTEGAAESDPDGTTTEDVATTSTESVGTTTEEKGNTATPLYDGVDILNGEYADMAISSNFNGYYPCAFEEHSVLGFRPALVFHMDPTDNHIYEELIITTDPDSTDNTSNWEVNKAYKWVVTIDGEDIEITNWSILNDQTGGFVRMDLGDWTYSTENLNEYDEHAYDCLLRIYGSDGKVAYWAWFTDDYWFGPYYFAPPVPIVMKDDVNRDPTHVAIDNTTAEPQSGPAGVSSEETYDFLFDGDVRSKLCTANTVDAIVWMFDSAQYVVSYSLVGANDDEGYTTRIPLVWTLSGSNDGSSWEVIDEKNLTSATAVNYGERNFKLDEPVEYEYFKLELVVSAMYQLSEIVLYTDVDHAPEAE